jgi:hypothetical protein
VGAHHDHPADAACLPACPAWAEGCLQLFAVQRRFAEMLEACRTAEAIEYVYVWPAQGAVLPAHLHEEDVVRLNLVAGRDAPEVMLDEEGIHCTLTFRGSRFDCELPWASIPGGVLRPPARKRPRFGVIEGAEPPVAPDAPAGAAAERPAGPPRLGLIQGGKNKKD